MACSITSPLIILVITTIMALSSSLVASQNGLPASTISAAPALLPDPISPLSSPPPSLSPDITPLFPSPGGSELSPTETSTPLIPSSPSPPNPDAGAAFGPGMAFAPSGIMPDSSSGRVRATAFMAVVFGGIWVGAVL